MTAAVEPLLQLLIAFEPQATTILQLTRDHTGPATWLPAHRHCEPLSERARCWAGNGRQRYPQIRSTDQPPPGLTGHQRQRAHKAALAVWLQMVRRCQGQTLIIHICSAPDLDHLQNVAHGP